MKVNSYSLLSNFFQMLWWNGKILVPANTSDLAEKHGNISVVWYACFPMQNSFLVSRGLRTNANTSQRTKPQQTHSRGSLYPVWHGHYNCVFQPIQKGPITCTRTTNHCSSLYNGLFALSMKTQSQMKCARLQLILLFETLYIQLGWFPGGWSSKTQWMCIM